MKKCKEKNTYVFLIPLRVRRWSFSPKLRACLWMRGNTVGCACAGEDGGMGRASGSVPAGEGRGEKPWKLESGFWPGRLGMLTSQKCHGEKGGGIWRLQSVLCQLESHFFAQGPEFGTGLGVPLPVGQGHRGHSLLCPTPTGSTGFWGCWCRLHVNTDMHLEKTVPVAPFSLLPGGNCLLTPTCFRSWGSQRPAHVLTRSHSDTCYSCSLRASLKISNSHNGSDFWEPPPALSLANKRPDGLSH